MKENQEPKEQFKTSIGGQALIEGILMRGPEKDAIVVRGADGLTVEVSDRKLNPKGSWKSLPFIRGIFNFFDAQVVGVKALMRSADLAPEEMQEEPGKFDLWLEKKLGSERFEATEALFKPELMGLECMGLSEMVFDAIQKAEIDLRPIVGAARRREV